MSETIVGMQLSTLLWICAFALGSFGILLEWRILRMTEKGVGGRGFIRALFDDAKNLLDWGGQRTVGRDEYARLELSDKAMREGVNELPGAIRAIRINTDEMPHIKEWMTAMEERMAAHEAIQATSVAQQDVLLGGMEVLMDGQERMDNMMGGRRK
jgi:hypothetical protein